MKVLFSDFPTGQGRVHLVTDESDSLRATNELCVAYRKNVFTADPLINGLDSVKV